MFPLPFKTFHVEVTLTTKCVGYQTLQFTVPETVIYIIFRNMITYWYNGKKIENFH